MDRPSSASDSDGSTPAPAGQCLTGALVLLLGRLAGMPRREAGRVIREQGGKVVEHLDTGDVAGQVSLLVVGDDELDWRSLAEKQSPALVECVDDGRVELLRESELWRRIGLVEGQQDVRRLYTPAMLAELLEIPVSVVRRWHRQGVLVACHCVRRLPYFDFAEVSIARHLADLLKAGCSPRVIERKLRELAELMPGIERPLADPGIVVEGRQLFIRRGDDLQEPSGQRQLNFDEPDPGDDLSDEAVQPSIPLSAVPVGTEDSASADAALPPAQEMISTLDQLQQEAVEWEDRGELDRAAETYRAILVAAGPNAEINFALADVLYRLGDLAAARERYYMAVEIDEEYVEARANLGCVLAETGDLSMAVAAFRGALAFHGDYADVHYHLADALDRLQFHDEAQFHWKTFLALAPESSWAETARARIAQENR